MSFTKKDQQMQNLKDAEKLHTLYKNYLAGGHKKPQTRREFMAAGLVSSSAYLLMPTLLQLITQHNAHAASLVCESGTSNTDMPAFINIQLAGGPALYAQHLACGAGGQLLRNEYSSMLGVAANERNFFANQAPFWFENDANIGSRMIRTLETRLAGTDIFTKSAFIGVAAKSLDDTANNANNITGMLQKAGLVGSTLPYLLTGNHPLNNKPALIAPSNTLNVFNSIVNIQDSLGFRGALGTFSADPTQNLTIQRRLIAAIEKLSRYQAEQIVSSPDSDSSQNIFKNLIQCSTEKNNTVLQNTTSVDIYNNYPGGPDYATIWAQNSGSAVFNTALGLCGQSVSNCMRGLSGATTIALTGYDYHAPLSRADANVKDGEFGDILGRVLLTAQKANRKVFIYVSADGSLNSTAGNEAQWGGDFGERGMQYIIAYDPAGAPSTGGVTVGSYSDAAFQLNHFAGTSVNTTNPIGATDAQELCGAAVFLNYLSFAGLTSKIDSAELAIVKNKLVSSLPAGAGTIQNYFLRINRG